MNDKLLYVSATVTGKRQITIPKEVCDQLNIETSDKVIFREKEGAILFEKATDEYVKTVSETFKYNFIIPFNRISDAIAMNNLTLVEEVFKVAEETVINGGKTIFQKEYSNSEPQVMRVIDNLKDLNDVKENLLGTK